MDKRITHEDTANIARVVSLAECAATGALGTRWLSPGTVLLVAAALAVLRVAIVAKSTKSTAVPPGFS